ncbi:MAG: NAD-dependent epimerase/dehydratase family protein, partial [Owenweeksia sp.]
MSEKILVLGASGQIGTDLVEQLRIDHGSDAVIASDIKDASRSIMEGGPFETLDARDGNRMLEVVKKHGITQVYHLVAMLSATAEKFPEKGWDLNMESLFHALRIAKDGHIKKLYWPSSIACFGPTTPKTDTPQFTVMDPGT